MQGLSKFRQVNEFSVTLRARCIDQRLECLDLLENPELLERPPKYRKDQIITGN